MTGTPFSPDPTRTAGAATDDSAGPSLEARLADRTRELDEVTRQHAATVEILDIIARSPGGLQTTLDAVVRAAVRHCGADDATMFLREGTEIFGAAHEGPLPSGFGARQQIQRSHLQTLVIRDGQIIHAPDTEALDPVEFASVIAVARQRGVRALVAAPIRHAGEVIGSLLLRRREVGPFSARQIAMLETVAAQAGIAVANAGVITELRESLEQQTATTEVLQVINASPGNTTPVFETILQKAHALCGIAYGSLQIYDGEKFRAVATHGLPEPLAMRLREGYAPGPNVRQLIDGAAFAQFPDIGLIDEPMARAAAEGGMKTLLCVALRTDGRLLGQIVCVRMEVRPFTDREIALLQGFAAQAVIAMENARLITETREALEQQTATADILRVISQSPTDIGPVLRAVVSAALRFCGAEDAMLALRDGDESVTAAHEGPLGGVVGTRARLDPRGRGTVRAIVERRTIHVPDVAAPDQNEFAVWRDLAREQNFRAFVVAPMMRDGVAIGSIGLRRPNPGPFTPRQIALLESFAAQAVIAIENVRLFTELRAALDRQTAMAEVLAVINANPGELTPVFDAILEKALSLSRSSYGILARFDGEKAWQVAGRNIPPALADLARGGHKPESGTMMHRLVLGDDVAHLADIRDDEAYRAGVPSRVLTADVAGARSQLLVALRKDGRLLGCINIYRTEVRAFSEAEVTLVRSFADQAVIAMENARLITETREALERQTAMAEVLAAINANPGELTPVFDTILDRALSLSGSSIGMLVRFDGEKGWLVAGRNVPPAVGDVALGGFIPAAGTLFHRMVLGDDVAFLADIRDDEAYQAGVPQRVILADEGGARSLLTVALRKDGRLLGGIQVYRTEVRAFSEAEVTLVRSFADQAVIAMENARLLTETREALEQQQASADVLSVISSSVADTAPVFERILDSCERLFGTNQVAICMVHDDGQVHARAVRGAVITKMMSVLPQPVAQTATGRAFRQASAVHIADAASEPDLPQSIRDAVARLGNYSCVFAPMLWERQGIGSICVTRQPPLPFTAKEIALLATFADQAVIAIQNARLFNETREALERQTAMAEVLAAINANPGELTPVFDTILDKALSLSRSSFGFLLRFEGEKFWMVAERDVPPGIKAFTLLGHVPEAGTLLHRMVLGDDVAYLADITDDEAYRAGAPSRVAMADEGGARSLLVVALRKDGRLLGCIQIYRTEVRAFSEAEVTLVRSFAAQAVIAMENARLITETQEALEQQRASADILSVISNSVADTQPVFDKILESCKHLFDGDELDVLLVDEQGQLNIAAYIGESHDAVAATFPAPVERTPAGRAIRERRVMHWPDLVNGEDVPGVLRKMAKLAGYRSMVFAPMLWEGRGIGAIGVARSTGPFKPKELSLLQTFADQAVIAIQNARLFNETKEALERQTATAEILSVISSSPTDVQPVFDAIVRSAAPLCNGLHAVFYRYDGALQHLVANNNNDDDEKFAETIAALHALYPLAPQRSTATGTALLDGAVVHVPDMQGDPRFSGAGHSIAVANGYRSSLAVPLLKEGRAIGVIYVVRRAAGRFAPEHIALLESFANQAVIAIENARLFNETKEALERQTAMAEVLEVISNSVEDTQPVFEKILESCQRLIECTDLAVLTIEADALVHVRAARGPHAWLTIEKYRPVPVGQSVIARAVEEGETVHIRDSLKDDNVPEVNRRLAARFGNLSCLITPLIWRGRCIGAMHVARSLKERNWPSFTDKDISLLKAFADQAVIAMENARLIAETREALEQQTATAGILQVISSSPTDAQPVFDAIAESAMRLLNGWSVLVWRYDGERMRVIASHGGVPGTDAASVHAALGEPRPEDLAYPGDAILKSDILQIVDVEAAGVPESVREVAHARGWRANIAVPMLRDGAPIGLITVSRKVPGAFAEREIKLLQTFAAQTVIAIDNVRLFTELRDSLEGLKAAQANLIQSEKMASLGQLTAGIAHEIKNPLNFVNNFAGLSVELLAEIKEMVAPAFAQLDEDKRAEIDETMALVTGNLEKIAEHGKRADGIVKSMLSHSRGGTGEWQAVDINALVEEALNLAYHGARAQDKSFNITLERDLAPASKPIEIVPQDVTRVFLNLFGNGFYAANKRRLAGTEAGFRPMLRVSTRDLGEMVEIKVRDNGTGIPDEVRAKLFQPFFTTKPTGEGTGLGLSISYDIVTQQHGGTVEVDSEVGSFTEFTVRLPRSRRAVPSRGA